jgi:nitrite reductase/ring-hydroxylating ferredoxin subunit
MNFKDLVRVDEGLISRSIYTDDQIYQLELERVFAKCWLYLGHDSQLKNDGDYFTTYMGEDSILVTRVDGDRIKAFLNSCRHRGMKLCRSDAGNQKIFMCPYHAWSYSNDGRLAGVPGYENAYQGKLDKTKWGLVEVPRVELFHGMIFATWDQNAEPLLEYLGGMAVYLDRVVNRMEGGVEVISGVQKWRIPANWKLIADNAAGDSYHVPVTHGSVVDIGLRARPGRQGHQVSAGKGHGFGSEAGGIPQGNAVRSPYANFIEKLRSTLSDDQPANKFIPLGHGNIFPNLGFLDTARIRMFRVSHPRGPWEVENHTYCLMDKALPDDMKMATRRDFILSFGPSGMFEQEDGEIMSEIMAGLRGHVSKRYEFNFEMGLGDEKPVKETSGGDLPGYVGRYWSEINQRAFYRHWRDLMTANA